MDALIIVEKSLWKMHNVFLFYTWNSRNYGIASFYYAKQNNVRKSNELLQKAWDLSETPNDTSFLWHTSYLIYKNLSDYKSALTKRIWNKYITTQYEKPQIQSLFQGFRMVGSKTKSGSSRTRAFRTGEPVDIEYLNQYVAAEHRIKEFVYKSKMTAKQTIIDQICNLQANNNTIYSK